ncbi:MAG: TonB-dependent receptor plug domain-containing protein, partial [Steroidobacteraceae bacterium]
MRASACGPFELLAKPALAVFLTAWLGVAAAQQSAPADPPQAAPAADTTQTLNEVVVTGSLIKQPSLTGSAALQVVNARDIKAAGTQTIETLLDSMPSVQGNFSLTQTSNPGGARGVASVDLRGLGPSRTLTLIDGKRVTPGDPLGGPAADL